MQTGFIKIDGKMYYFDPNLKDENDIEGLKFIPSKSGIYKIDNKYYYIYSNNSIYKSSTSGKKKIGNKYYYIYSNGTVFVGGWKKINNKNHYFTTSGAKIGWAKIGKYYYYFSSTGILNVNTIVGKYYVNKSGKRITTKTSMEAVKLVNKISKNKKNNTKAKKLKACYNYIYKTYKYKRSYAKPTSKGKNWTSYYAYQMYKKKKGNCYNYASSFAYCAKVLGYDARVVTGKIVALGGGMTPHGWVEIKHSNGKLYLYDPNMQKNYKNINSYQRTYKKPPFGIKKQKVYPINL